MNPTNARANAVSAMTTRASGPHVARRSGSHGARHRRGLAGEADAGRDQPRRCSARRPCESRRAIARAGRDSGAARASISKSAAASFCRSSAKAARGKSTLLHLLGTLDAADAGEIHFDGRRIDNLPAHERDALRNTQFGMIFQFYHLLPELTTLENVLAPLMIGAGVLALSGAAASLARAGHANCSTWSACRIA